MPTTILPGKSVHASFTNSGSASVSLFASLASGGDYRIRLANSSNPAIYGSSFDEKFPS